MQRRRIRFPGQREDVYIELHHKILIENRTISGMEGLADYYPEGNLVVFLFEKMLELHSVLIRAGVTHFRFAFFGYNSNLGMDDNRGAKYSDWFALSGDIRQLATDVNEYGKDLSLWLGNYFFVGYTYFDLYLEGRNFSQGYLNLTQGIVHGNRMKFTNVFQKYLIVDKISYTNCLIKSVYLLHKLYSTRDVDQQSFEKIFLDKEIAITNKASKLKSRIINKEKVTSEDLENLLFLKNIHNYFKDIGVNYIFKIYDAQFNLIQEVGKSGKIIQLRKIFNHIHIMLPLEFFKKRDIDVEPFRKKLVRIL